MKIGMIFPGYGSQFVGMGKELYDESRVVQEYFEDAANCLNMNFIKLCFASSEVELGKMDNAYVSLFLVSSAIAALLKEEGIEPTVVAGYNLGEYSAIHAVGGFSFPDGLYLLNKLALFYQEFLSSHEVEIIRVQGLETEKLQTLCEQVSSETDKAFIAIYEKENQQVVGGTRRAVQQVYQDLSTRSAVTVSELGVEVGLHSPLLDAVAAQFKIYLEKVDFKDLRVPLFSAVSAQKISAADEVKANVVEHIHRPLLWAEVIQQFNECDVIVEVGPGTTLTDYFKEAFPEKKIFSVNTRADFDALHAFLNEHKQHNGEQ